LLFILTKQVFSREIPLFVKIRFFNQLSVQPFPAF
jgi:hypothetical protein